MSKNTIIWGVVLVLFIVFVVWLIKTPSREKPSIYNEFAQCLADKGVKFYGAFWCPHCQAQKALFGSAAKKLPYIECSQPNGKDQTKVCEDAKILSYPTWEFPVLTASTTASSTRMSGEISLADLSKLSSCLLPQS